MRSLDPVRAAVQKELRGPSSRTARRRRGTRLAASLAMALALAGPMAASAAIPRFERTLLPGLAGFDLGVDSSPAVVDLDGDGDSDVVVGSLSLGIQYLKNSGTSAAPAFVGVTGTGNPFSGLVAGQDCTPALADLDDDGDLDAVVGSNPGTLDYLENTGTPTAPEFVALTGSASPFAGIDVGSLSNPALTDLDGDGDLDAVVGELQGGLHYLRNTGSSKAPAYVEETGTGNPFAGIDLGYLSSPGLADLDADGDPDAVVGSSGAVLAYFLNTGSSTAPAFVAADGSWNPFNGTPIASDPDLTDLDADGDLDAVVGHYSGSLRYLRNSGTSTTPAYVGATGTANPIAGVDVGLYSAPSLADLDGDGDVDSVVGDFDGLLRYFRNTGSPAAPRYLAVTGSGNPFAAIDVGVWSAPTLADVDGDGDLDAAVGSFDGTLAYLRNTGSSTAPAHVQVTGTGNPFGMIDVDVSSFPALADVDGDGDLDLMVGELYGTLRYFRNIGSATAPAYLELTGAGHPLVGVDVGTKSAPALADLDEDGDLDVVVGDSQSGDLVPFQNTGSPTAPAYVAVTGTANPFAGFGVGYASRPALADVDGDGDVDAVVGEDGGSLAFLRSRAAIFADSFESGDTSGWSLTVP